jgi:DNA repair photolyase
MDDHAPLPRRGRATTENTPNRFERLHLAPDPEDPAEEAARPLLTEVLRDTSRSALSRNDSPDLPFRWSLNPYRGCEHGCPYCYARPSHEYLGFSAGLDFETRIVAKPDLPDLLAKTYQKASWQPEVVVVSGNTDPYQPIERKMELTRRCLEVFVRHRHPVGLITKNALVLRDLDMLRELAALDLVYVTVSLTTLRDEIAGPMEPRASRPARRLHAIERLAEAGVPVGVNAAPLIPGLTDEELPAILAAAAGAGATMAGYMVVRLPGPVEPIFTAWLRRTFPDRAERVLNRLREVRGGHINEARFGHRMRTQGPWGDVLRQMFCSVCARHGLGPRYPELATHHFRRLPGGQMGLF